jgi:hypothetical protein
MRRYLVCPPPLLDCVPIEMAGSAALLVREICGGEGQIVFKTFTIIM